MGKFVSDQEMMHLETQSRPKKIISDSEMSQMEESANAPSPLQTFGKTALNAATLGYLPEIQAAQPPLNLNFKTGDISSNVNETSKLPFTQRREKYAKVLDDESAANPGAAVAGTVAGALGGGALLAPLMPAGAATMGGRIASSAKVGGLLGFVQNPQQQEGAYDPLQLGTRLKGGAVGAALGGGTSAALEGAGAMAGNLSKRAAGKAEEKAFKVVGGTPTQIAKAQASGADKQIGRTLLDQGAISPFTSSKSLASKVEVLKDEAGQTVGDLISGASAQAGKVIDSKTIADEVRALPEFSNLANTPGKLGQAKALDQELNALVQNGQMSLEEAHTLRRGIDEGINYSKKTQDLQGNQEVLYKIRSAIRDRMNGAINSLDTAAGSGGKDRLLQANRSYGNLSQADEMLGKTLARQANNNSVSLTDKMAGFTGVLSGTSLTAKALLGTAGTLLNKGARTYGNSLAATGLDTLSKRLASVPRAAQLATSNPAAFQSLVAQVSQAVQGKNQMAPGESDPIIENPRLLELFKADPNLVDQIQDPMRRRAVKLAISRGPAEGK